MDSCEAADSESDAGAKRCILRVAVPVPARTRFDYLPPAEAPRPIRPGVRVRVPFGSRRLVGVVLEVAASSEVPSSRLRPVSELLDREPILPAASIALLEWAAQYYRYPIGEVVAGALPLLLRRGRPARLEGARHWRLTPEGNEQDPQALQRAPRQAAVLLRLREAHPDPVPEAELPPRGRAAVLRALREKGWARASRSPCLLPPSLEPDRAPRLSSAQQAAVDAVGEGFQGVLLQGVTGSGKTEVYLHLIEQALERRLQSLVLVPEIGLTPQVVERFRRRFRVPVAVLHSGLSPTERLCAWLAVAEGRAPIVIGTRSAVFVPLPRPGLFIVDEEHDASFKQQDGFRYSARDIAVMRARESGVPVLLGSATPSLETLHNAARGRYLRVRLTQRAGSAVPPRVRLVDVRALRMQEGLSPALLAAIRARLERGEQSLLFLNRRGYAPRLQCHACGWVAECDRCDARLTLYREAGRLRCQHCGAARRVPRSCPSCGSEQLRVFGTGTQRVEPALHAAFPGVGIVRVDRDSMSRRGALESVLERVHDGSLQVLLGTQMLAKGHDFPNVTLVGVLDADQGLFGVDFRAPERLAQLIVQVAGRAGRADKPGEVLIQTHHPEHPLLRAMLRHDYDGFAAAALEERRASCLPPFSSLALLRAESTEQEAPQAFLQAARDSALGCAVAGVQVLGPVPAPMERRAGRYRAQLLLQASRRSDLQRLLGVWIGGLDRLQGVKRVRWSVDVDPVEMF